MTVSEIQKHLEEAHRGLQLLCESKEVKKHKIEELRGSLAKCKGALELLQKYQVG